MKFRNRRIQLIDNQNKEHQEIGKELDLTNPEDLPKYIWPFTYLFNKKKFKNLLERQEWDDEINLIEDTLKELNTKTYAMTIKEDETLNQWYVALYFYIPKKDGLLWLVQDYRKLNQHTIKDKMPLLLIGEVINKLKEAKYFNKLDLIWGYNNIWIKEGDKWKAVF